MMQITPRRRRRFRRRRRIVAWTHSNTRQTCCNACLQIPFALMLDSHPKLLELFFQSRRRRPIPLASVQRSATDWSQPSSAVKLAHSATCRCRQTWTARCPRKSARGRWPSWWLVGCGPLVLQQWSAEVAGAHGLGQQNLVQQLVAEKCSGVGNAPCHV